VDRKRTRIDSHVAAVHLEGLGTKLGGREEHVIVELRARPSGERPGYKETETNGQGTPDVARHRHLSSLTAPALEPYCNPAVSARR
jgi:hypothetical protein